MKLFFNRKYTTIAIYSVMVFIICALFYRLAFNFDVSMVALGNFMGLMAPFAIALFIAYFISPMVAFFENRVITKIRVGKKRLTSFKAIRMLSILSAYIIVLGTIVLLLAFVIPQLAESISDIAVEAPKYFTSVMAWLDQAEVTLAGNRYVVDLTLMDSLINENLPQTFDQFTQLLTSVVPDVLNATRVIASGVINILFGFIVAIYLLYNKESYMSNSRKIITALLPINRTESFFKTLSESHKIFSSFFVGKMIDSLIIGLMCFVIMLIARIPYPLLISVVVGITNMIPYFGPFIGGGIGIAFLLIAAPVKALWFAVVILGLQQFDGNILGPKILGDSTGLTPFWVIFAIILFGGFFGLLGMFIGVPCFAVIKNIFDGVIDRRYREKMAMMAEEPEEHLEL